MKKLWVEKHRPSNIEDVIFASEKIKNIFRSYVQDQEIPNLKLFNFIRKKEMSIRNLMVNLMVSKPDTGLLTSAGIRTWYNSASSASGKYLAACVLGGYIYILHLIMAQHGRQEFQQVVDNGWQFRCQQMVVN